MRRLTPTKLHLLCTSAADARHVFDRNVCVHTQQASLRARRASSPRDSTVVHNNTTKYEQKKRYCIDRVGRPASIPSLGRAARNIICVRLQIFLPLAADRPAPVIMTTDLPALRSSESSDRVASTPRTLLRWLRVLTPLMFPRGVVSIDLWQIQNVHEISTETKILSGFSSLAFVPLLSSGCRATNTPGRCFCSGRSFRVFRPQERSYALVSSLREFGVDARGRIKRGAHRQQILWGGGGASRAAGVGHGAVGFVVIR